MFHLTPVQFKYLSLKVCGSLLRKDRNFQKFEMFKEITTFENLYSLGQSVLRKSAALVVAGQ